MELRRYVAILRRRLLIIILTTLAGLLAGYVTTDQTPRFTASATLYVGSRNLIPSGGSIGGDVLSGLERFSSTYASMIASAPIASDALQRAKLARSPGSVVAETQAAPKKGTQLLVVKVVDRDPAVAQLLANSLVDAFVEKISSFEPNAQPQPGEIPALPAYVFERAGLPAVPQSTGLARHLLLGGLFGLGTAAAIAFILEYIDITVKSVSDAERKLELPVLGVIPMDPDAPQRAATDGWTARAS